MVAGSEPPPVHPAPAPRRALFHAHGHAPGRMLCPQEAAGTRIKRLVFASGRRSCTYLESLRGDSPLWTPRFIHRKSPIIGKARFRLFSFLIHRVLLSLWFLSDSNVSSFRRVYFMKTLYQTPFSQNLWSPFRYKACPGLFLPLILGVFLEKSESWTQSQEIH